MVVHLREDFYAVELPQEAIVTGLSEWSLYFNYKGISYLHALSRHEYEFLFCTIDCIEEDAANVVESEELFINAKSQGILYAVYYNNGKKLEDVCEWHNRAKNSLKSLLRSKGLPTTKNYAIIKRITPNADRIQ